MSWWCPYSSCHHQHHSLLFEPPLVLDAHAQQAVWPHLHRGATTWKKEGGGESVCVYVHTLSLVSHNLCLLPNLSACPSYSCLCLSLSFQQKTKPKMPRKREERERRGGGKTVFVQEGLIFTMRFAKESKMDASNLATQATCICAMLGRFSQRHNLI